MDKSKNIGLFITISVLLLVIIVQYFILNKYYIDKFNHQITTLHHQNDSLLLDISKNESKIHKMDSLIIIYKSRVDSSKSELVNDLIRQARNQQQQIDLIRLKLDRAEKSGFTTDSKSEILKQSKKLLNG